MVTVEGVRLTVRPESRPMEASADLVLSATLTAVILTAEELAVPPPLLSSATIMSMVLGLFDGSILNVPL